MSKIGLSDHFWTEWAKQNKRKGISFFDTIMKLIDATTVIINKYIIIVLTLLHIPIDTILKMSEYLFFLLGQMSVQNAFTKQV